MCSVVTRPAQDISQKVRDELLAVLPYIREVSWLGGEVFLYPDFEILLSAGIANSVRQNIVTNGLLIDEKMAIKLIENNISVTFSIDGSTKEVYENIRRGASFETLKEKVRMMQRLREKIRPEYAMDVCMVIMRSNYRQITNLVAFAQTYGFGIVRYQYLYDSQMFPEEDLFTINRDVRLLKQVQESLAAAKVLCEQAGIQFSHNIPEGLFGDSNTGGPVTDGDTTGDANDPDSRALLKQNCYAPWSHLSITVEGKVIPQAHCLCNNSVGNLNTESLDALWDGESMARYREALVSGRIETICTLKSNFHRIPYEVFDR